jgi:hypothetical protein
MRRTVTLGFLLLSLSGCSKPVDEVDYPGTYVIERSQTKNIVIVLSGGKYKHRFELGQTAAEEREGLWDKDESGGRIGITFKSFQYEIGGPGKGGFWFVVPSRDAHGIVQLCIDVEETNCFKKVK